MTTIGSRLRALALTAAVAVATGGLAACNGEDDTDVVGGPATTTIEGPRCQATEYSVTYPEGWYVHEPENGGLTGPGPCSLFHPEELELGEQADGSAFAIRLSVEDRYPAVVDSLTHGAQVVERSERTVAGHEATRLELVVEEGAEEDAELEVGAGRVVWAVDLQPIALVASATEQAGVRLENTAAVLDAMMTEGLEIPDEPRCSGSEVTGTLPDQDLPDPVAATRQAIYEAATACDYEALNDLAGPEFSYTFGGAQGPPSAYWRIVEATAAAPMRFLAALLTTDPATVAGADPAVYAWPAAFTYDSWSAVPDDARSALAGEHLYSEAELATFAELDAYLGWRAGITATGTWIYFISGD